MKSILGIGNALTDILAVLPDDSLLEKYHLPKGSMQHVDMETGDRIWTSLKELGVKYVPGGSAANTITCTSIFGMPSAYIGKIGNDELGSLFKSTMEQSGVKTTMLYGTKSSGRCMAFISGANAERTFANYMGAALEMQAEDLKQEYFEGYDYFHIEGYLVQDQELIRTAAQMAHEAGSLISIDLASYNVVESNDAFLHNREGSRRSHPRPFPTVRHRCRKGGQRRLHGPLRGRGVFRGALAGQGHRRHRRRRHLRRRLPLWPFAGPAAENVR